MTSLRPTSCLSVLLVSAVLFAPACRSTQASWPTPPGPEGQVVQALSAYVEHELADKGIPGLSIALVDGDQVVWAGGFGMADIEAGIPATAETVYRIGSVSKLFTDIGVMQLVERGELDLDAPVQDALPDLRPQNPYEEAITLRQLMCHRSGLVREPPVGHYFDASSPSLAATVASLNGTQLVYAPETRIKYSNAAIAAVGYALEVHSGEPFADYLQRSVLEPIGMDDSAFAPTDALRRRLAKAVMWSFDGREFPAPTFELGMSPAGSMYSTVLDLSEFMHVLFARGATEHGQLLQPASLDEMLRPQFAEEGAESGFGLGFAIGSLDGHRSIGHGGAVYGFATSFKVLPGEELGVVAVANMDVVNSVTGRIVDQALRWMLAARAGEELASAPTSGPVGSERAAQLAGHYASDEAAVELSVRGEELMLAGERLRGRVRESGDGLLVDDRHRRGPALEPLAGDALRIGGDTYARVQPSRPSPPPERYRGLVGEYGWDHNVLFVFERDSELVVLVEWMELDPLTELSPSEFAFPDTGLYHGERIVFRRDASGRASEAIVAGLRFPRRALQGESVETFSIEPLRTFAELRGDALRASPPEERGEFHDTDLVEIQDHAPTVRLDVRYASTNNFMGARFYDEPRAFLQRPAAEALARVQASLAEQGYGLLVHDAYRPWYVTKMFWDATPEESRIFVADPSKGSRHNRGCAVDLTLCDLESGEPLEMVGLYDEFSERSYPDYVGGTSLQRWGRELLRGAMEAEGFSVYAYEWWHFDYDGWERYRIGNQVFGELLRP